VTGHYHINIGGNTFAGGGVLLHRRLFSIQVTGFVLGLVIVMFGRGQTSAGWGRGWKEESNNEEEQANSGKAEEQVVIDSGRSAKTEVIRRQHGVPSG